MKDKINMVDQWIDSFFTSKWSIIFIFLISSLIVLPNITRESLWFDEIFSANASLTVSSLHEMFTQYIFKDVHPPFYQMLLYFWSKIGGDSDFNIRLLSYVSILISIFFSFSLLNKYFTKKIAIIFAVISIFTPAILYYAEEARPYALMYGLANILSTIYVIFAVNIKQHRNIQNNLLIAYFILGVLALYTHFFGYILIFSLSIILLGYSTFLHRKETTSKLFVISFLILIAGLIWLYIIFYYGNIADKMNGHFWIKNSFSITATNLGIMLYGHKEMLLIETILGVFLIFPFQIFFSSFKKNTFILLPVFSILIISILISLNTPIITARNLIIIIPLIMLFISFLFNDLYNSKKIVILVYLVALFTSSAYYNSTYQKECWKCASAYIEKNFDPNNCKVPTNSYADIYSSYYLGNKFSYLRNGPELQKNCDLIYFAGHTKKEEIIKTLSKKRLDTPFDIIDFHDVYVVIKKRP